MKKLILAALIGFLSTAIYAKADDVPEAVKTKFASEYPNVKKVKWDYEDGKYEAHFEINDLDHSVVYDANGNKLESEVEIEASALPKGVAEYVSKNYPGEKFKETAKITDDKGTVTYEAEVKAGDLIFDANGNFLKLKGKAEEKDDDDNDKKEEKK